MVHQPFQHVGPDVQAFRDGGEGPAQVVGGERHPGPFRHALDGLFRLHQVSLRPSAWKDPGGGGGFPSPLKEVQHERRQRQRVRLAVFRVRNGERAVGQVDIRPAQLQRLGAAQAGEQQHQQVVGDGVAVAGRVRRFGGLAQAGHRLAPRRELVALDQRAPALAAIPGPGAGQAQDRVVGHHRPALAVLVGRNGEIEQRAQKAHGAVGVVLAARVAQLAVVGGDPVFGDAGQRPACPALERHRHEALVVVERFRLEVAARSMEVAEGLAQGDGLEPGPVRLGHRIAAHRNLAQQLVGLLAGLLHGELAVAAQGDPAHPAPDALFQHEGARAGGGDSQAEALEFGVADKALAGGRWGGLVDDGFGQPDRLIVRFCRHNVDTPCQTPEITVGRFQRKIQSNP